MERNITTEVTEKLSATSDEMANMLKADWPSNVGIPLSWLTPPGTVADVAKATVAMRAATTEQDSEVLVSHRPPSSTMFWWLWLNSSFGDWFCLL